MSNNPNTQLPAEVVEQIKQEGQYMLAFVPDNKWSYIQGATAYATKLVECDKANSALEEKNRQIMELLEANFKEFLRSHKCMTEDEITEAWEVYKINNNL